MFALSPTVIHSIAFSVVLSSEISIHCLFVCLFLTAANAFGTPRPISGSHNYYDVMQLQNVINKH